MKDKKKQIVYDFLMFLFLGFLRVASFDCLVISNNKFILNLSRWMFEGPTSQAIIFEAHEKGQNKMVIKKEDFSC